MSPQTDMRAATDEITLTVNGRQVRARAGASVAAVILSAGAPCRISVSGEPRAPLCGMGICMECRATVNGTAHVRTCQLAARHGMTVVTE
ncbi:MAG: (2Fe-2S)-binding protein [Terracidiphilus sp.]